jgi:glutathione-regulated potassium-efflux system ancillary protein KefG
MRSLVIVSHPTLATSRANAPLVEAIRDLPDVELRHLEALYPDGRIDIPAEQAAALRAERIVFQFPFYWYSTPPMLKRAGRRAGVRLGVRSGRRCSKTGRCSSC